MLGWGEDLIYEAHDALQSQLVPGGNQDHAFETAMMAMKDRAYEVVARARGCAGCFMMVLNGILLASLKEALGHDADGGGGRLDDDKGLSWEDMLRGGGS